MMSNGVKMTQNGPKWGQNGSKWVNIRSKSQSMVRKMAQNRPRMAQNRPKWPKAEWHCQKERKLRPNTPQGHSGWHRFAAFGPPGAKFGPQKGPKGPICCQIWNAFGSIDSVFGSSARPWGSKGVKMAQNGSK